MTTDLSSQSAVASLTSKEAFLFLSSWSLFLMVVNTDMEAKYNWCVVDKWGMSTREYCFGDFANYIT